MQEGSPERESYIQKKGERKGRSSSDAGGGRGEGGKLSSTGQAGKQRIRQGDTRGKRSPPGSLVCVPPNLGSAAEIDKKEHSTACVAPRPGHPCQVLTKT